MLTVKIPQSELMPFAYGLLVDTAEIIVSMPVEARI